MAQRRRLGLHAQDCSLQSLPVWEGLCNNQLLEMAFKDSRLLCLLVHHRCLQWCLEAGIAERLDCGFRRWALPCCPLPYLVVIWDPDAAQEPGALRAGRGQGSCSYGSTFGTGNILMALCPAQPSAPPSPPPGTWLTGEVPLWCPRAAPAPPCAVRCLELAGLITQLPHCHEDVDRWVNCKTSYLLELCKHEQR